MRYLIDTNIFIDMVKDEDISTDIRTLVANYENLIYVSSESLKEYLHLVQTGKVMPKGDL